MEWLFSLKQFAFRHKLNLTHARLPEPDTHLWVAPFDAYWAHKTAWRPVGVIRGDFVLIPVGVDGPVAGMLADMVARMSEALTCGPHEGKVCLDQPLDEAVTALKREYLIHGIREYESFSGLARHAQKERTNLFRMAAKVGLPAPALGKAHRGKGSYDRYRLA